jgi:Ser/Thr protein kinase RdoA (MazF antagonist)
MGFFPPGERRNNGRMNKPAVVYSTLSSDAVRDLVLPVYDVGSTVECSLLNRGLNDTYLVGSDGHRWVLRIYRRTWRTEEAIRGEVAALVQLGGRGVPLAAPISRTDGEWLTPVAAPEGLRWAVLFRWVGGVQPKYIDATHAKLYGQVAARLHIAADNLPSCTGRMPLDSSYLLKKPVEVLRPLLNSRPLLATRFEALLDRTAARLEQAREQLSDWGFCHGDLHGGNAHVDGDRLALFDFDCCGLGWRVYDLATYRWAARLRGVAEKAWAPFINAYLEARPAAANTLEHVPLFVLLRDIWLQGYFAWSAVETGTSYQTDRYVENLISFWEQIESERIGPT